MANVRRSGAGVLLILAGAICACDKAGEVAPATTESAAQVFEMRGIVEALPVAALPRRLRIHHEATSNMGSMTMAFNAAQGVPLAGLAVGDKVAFRFEVDLAAETELITKLEKLPADTVLNFGDQPAPKTSSKPGQ